jgi:hypothetical protein
LRHWRRRLRADATPRIGLADVSAPFRDKKAFEDIVTRIEMRANNVEAMRQGRKAEHSKIVREFNVGRVPTRAALIRIGQNFFFPFSLSLSYETVE